jgi:hypothetical protein
MIPGCTKGACPNPSLLWDLWMALLNFTDYVWKKSFFCHRLMTWYR